MVRPFTEVGTQGGWTGLGETWYGIHLWSHPFTVLSPCPQGRFTIAAKHHISIAEIYETELVDVEKVSWYQAGCAWASGAPVPTHHDALPCDLGRQGRLC